MGCDIFWNAKEPDIQKQRQCSLFLHAFYEVQKWDCEVYSGEIIGAFYDYRNRKVFNSLNLIGVTTYFNMKDMRGTVFDFAERQFSFVFNNTLDNTVVDQHSLITIDVFSSSEIEEFHWLKEELTANRPDSNLSNYGIFKTGGYDRAIENAFHFFVLFYLVKTLFIPSLSPCDDYDYWAAVNKWATKNGYDKALMSPSDRWDAIEEMINSNFKNKFYRHNITPGLKSFWDVDI
ncbi:MAG: hypothetical protein ACYDEE_06180 [Ignavibacteriaceae bacterium]